MRVETHIAYSRPQPYTRTQHGVLRGIVYVCPCNIEVPFKVVTKRCRNFANDILTVEMAQSYRLCTWHKSMRLLLP